MVEEKIFRCEHCLAIYKTAAEAEACENNHKKCDEIIQVKYTQQREQIKMVNLVMFSLNLLMVVCSGIRGCNYE